MIPSRFHLSLNVTDLAGTAAVLETLLGSSPAQAFPDYAKFELSEPPLVLALAPCDALADQRLNHLGFRLPNRQRFLELCDRLSAAGVEFQREDSVACCHSRQSKLWIHDPAGNLWELYVLEDAGAGDRAAEGGEAPLPIAALAAHVAKSSDKASQAAQWSHRLGTTLPERIPAADLTLDEVVLEGTFNESPTTRQFDGILKEAQRALRGGGRLLLHGLSADRPLEHAPSLPGPAAGVTHAPTTEQLFQCVLSAGFVGAELLTFGEIYRFAHAGADLRETRLQAWKREAVPAAPMFSVVYRGPFAELRDDSGQAFRRGERVRVDRDTYWRLRQPANAAQFVFEAADDQVASPDLPVK